MIFLDCYLSYHRHRGRESFETHVWMLKTLLEQSRVSDEDLEAFELFSIASSFDKMNMRMTNKRISAPYLHCLLTQTTFPFITLSSLVPKAGDRNSDEPFIQAIPFLAIHTVTKIPNLSQHAANLEQLIDIYNEDTYMEFHHLLCEFLSKFRASLETLRALQRNRTEGDLGEILKALNKVRVFGHYLRIMVSSSAIEKHLQTIATFLDVDPRKMWRPEPGEPESEDADFQCLKPYSVRKGKPLLPWESYRDWLRLMVHYFDATQVLAAHVATFPIQCTPHDTLSITILSPPLPGNEMLPWTEILKSDRFFPTLHGETSGDEFISFLKKSYDEDTSPAQVLSATKSARLLADSGENVSADNIDKLTRQVGKCTSVGRKDTIDRIVEKLRKLKSFESRDQRTQLRAIVETLETLTKRAQFHDNLKQGSLCSGQGFCGKHHCEAYIASLLTLLSSVGRPVDDFEERLKTLSEKEIGQIKELLTELQVSHFFMHHLNLC